MGNIYESCCQSPSGQQNKTSRVESKRQASITITNPSLVGIKQQSKLNWNDFQPVKYLCKSEIGQVTTVKLKGSKSDKLYAMKIVQKNKIKQENLLQNAELQTVVLAEDNPFIVKILHVSQNKLNIYILMEYIAGRDLYYFLMEENEVEKYFSEEVIMQVAAEALLGLEFLHSKGIIYRELKPQNLLCTQDGHIKLTDYALSRFERVNEPTMTYLGNIQYTAPQMLDKTKGYNRFADIWSFGILLFQLKYRRTPFKDQDPRVIYDKIKSGRLQFPSSHKISPDLQDLIKKLTNPYPQNRPKISQIKRHPFFSKLNWNDVQKRKNNTGLKQIMSNYNLKIRGQHDNPPARVYTNSVSRKDSPTKVFDFTCAGQDSFKTKQS